MAALTVSALLAVAFLTVERRATKPLFPPHVWKLSTIASGTTVKLGVTGILVGAVFHVRASRRRVVELRWMATSS